MNLSIDEKLARMVFSGELTPGTRLVERDLAKNLGLSRIPVREALMKLVAKGVLVRDPNGRGVRLREYLAEEVRQLYELREAIEVSAARSACRKATEPELVCMEMICEEMETEIGNYGSRRWADLDRRFHETMVAASQNERFVNDFALLLAECHYVFYFHPARQVRPNPGKEWIREHMAEVIADHRALLAVLGEGQAEKADSLVREHMRKSVVSATRAIVAEDLRSRKSS